MQMTSLYTPVLLVCFFEKVESAGELDLHSIVEWGGEISLTYIVLWNGVVK